MVNEELLFSSPIIERNYFMYMNLNPLAEILYKSSIMKEEEKVQCL